LSKYQDVVDFYDIHIYDDNPTYPDWRSVLRKPYIVGEAGASTTDQHLDDQTLNSRAVSYLLQHSQAAGVSLVLVQGEAFPQSRDSLTLTGAAVAKFLDSDPAKRAGAGKEWNPVGALATGIVSTARRIKRIFRS